MRVDDKLASLLATRLEAVQERITQACARVGRQSSEVTLVAVTKTTMPEIAALLPSMGVPDLGENRPQQLWDRAAKIPNARWHLIGHLQRNKIDRTMPCVAITHSVDSLRLLNSLAEYGRKNQRSVPMLLEFNCSREENKGGFAVTDVPQLCELLPTLPGVDVCGLMTMAAYAAEPEATRPTFVELRDLRDRIAIATGLKLPHLSMGMSNDFEVAIEEGSTMIRLGSILFEGLSTSIK